mgnify:CR=1 FL=1
MTEYVITSSTANFEEDVLNSSLPAIVYFYSDDCLPCMTFSQIFDRAAVELHGQIRFVKIFRPHNRQLAEKYNVKTSPTIMFFKNSLEICTRLTGYINNPEFKNSIENVLGKACPKKDRTIVRCDVLIIGAGPAGLTAAIYASRSRLYTIVIDTSLPGGQVATTFHVANYPGTNGVVRGLDLMENMKNQALSFGTQIDDMQQIIEVNLDGNEKFVKTDQNDYYTKTVIIATGAEPRKLPVRNEQEFRGRGIHYCATCDGALYQDAEVMVIGGGTSAVEEAEFLTRYAKHVTVVNRSDKFKASKASVDEMLKNPSISVMYNSVVKEIKGESFVTSAVIENNKTNEINELKTDGIFVYIGMQPNTAIFDEKLNTAEGGYIITDNKMMTNLPGVFAAGDVRDKEIRQITTAVGDGTIAGIMAERYINGK